MKMRGQASNVKPSHSIFISFQEKKQQNINLIPNVTIRFFSCSNEKKTKQQHKN